MDDNVITHYPHIASMLYNTPLLIHPDKAMLIEKILREHAQGIAASVDVNAIAVRQRPSRDQPYTTTEGGTAIISVFGTLVHRAGWLDGLSGLQSYTELADNIAHATRNAAVKGILLEIDSHGGAVSGLYELASQILATRAVKPIRAIANENAYSAAYAIACATQHVTAPRSAGLGSIGVIALHVDQSKFDAAIGVKYTAIYAGTHKNDFSQHEPLNDSARDRAQSIIDDAYAQFVNHVAEARELKPEAVRATEAQVYTAQEAVGIGLADAIAGLDETVEQLESTYQTVVSFNTTRASARTNTGAIIMKANDQILLSALSISMIMEHRPDLHAAIVEEAIKDLIKPDAHAAAIATAKTEGGSAERERIQAVEAVLLPGHEALITTLKYDGKTTGPEAAVQVLNAEKAKTRTALSQQEQDAAALAGVSTTVTQAGDQGQNNHQQKGFTEEGCKADWEANKGGCQQEFSSFENYRAYMKNNAEGRIRVIGNRRDK